MLITGQYNKLHFKNGKLHQCSKRFKPIIEYNCDKCGKHCIELYSIFEYRQSLINLIQCGKCSRKLMSGIAGKKGQYDEFGNLRPNAGRFSTERVEAMNEDEYKLFCDQRKNATLALHEKLNSNLELKEEHYRKVFKHSTIGYISNGQRELFELLEPFGFELELLFEGFKCDIVNVEKRVVIEYYGDYWHANPRFYDENDFIKVINLTAKQKWDNDRKRNFALRNKGVQVIIIWENEWINFRDNVFEKIKNLVDTDFKFPDFEKKLPKSKWINDGVKNKMVKFELVNEYLQSGWSLGRL
jgi:very-short-patch-repair endonuclease